MATPSDLDDFALGFSLSEGIITKSSELESIKVRELLEGIVVDVTIPEKRAEAIATRQRNMTGQSSCGLCGTQSLADAVRQPRTVGKGTTIGVDVLHRALAALPNQQPVNALTGATHAAAWIDDDGEIVMVREDVGRHNALDKVIGAMTRDGIDASDGAVVISSRASYEMVQKAATAGITIIVAISAATALAIQMAESTGVTLIGYARQDRHVIYTHPQRVRSLATASATT
ncbi:MAG: formate dehydrogenase accessory sulfurtransferase FdhD, partial [Dokdonella sp.]